MCCRFHRYGETRKGRYLRRGEGWAWRQVHVHTPTHTHIQPRYFRYIMCEVWGRPTQGPSPPSLAGLGASSLLGMAGVICLRVGPSCVLVSLSPSAIQRHVGDGGDGWEVICPGGFFTLWHVVESAGLDWWSRSRQNMEQKLESLANRGHLSLCRGTSRSWGIMQGGQASRVSAMDICRRDQALYMYIVRSSGERNLSVACCNHYSKLLRGGDDAKC